MKHILLVLSLLLLTFSYYMWSNITITHNDSDYDISDKENKKQLYLIFMAVSTITLLYSLYGVLFTKESNEENEGSSDSCDFKELSSFVGKKGNVIYFDGNDIHTSAKLSPRNYTPIPNVNFI